MILKFSEYNNSYTVVPLFIFPLYQFDIFSYNLVYILVSLLLNMTFVVCVLFHSMIDFYWFVLVSKVKVSLLRFPLHEFFCFVLWRFLFLGSCFAIFLFFLLGCKKYKSTYHFFIGGIWTQDLWHIYNSEHNDENAVRKSLNVKKHFILNRQRTFYQGKIRI